MQQIDIRDEASLAKIGLKWNDDYTELLDVKTGKPLDDFEEMQKKQREATRFDIAVRAMRGEFTKAKGKTEGEVYGEIMDTLTVEDKYMKFPISMWTVSEYILKIPMRHT